MKKVVVLCGGRGSSSILRGLKLFPVDLTAIVSVSDDGKSTGKLREEFNVPAVGDLNKVITHLSETEPLMENLLSYRFKSNGNFDGHSLGNMILISLIDITGSLVEALKVLSKIMNIKGKILPFTEDNPTLIAYTKEGEKLVGESHITKAFKQIDYIEYQEKPKVLAEAIDAVKEADLIIFGIGSLYTSIIPNILSDDMKKAILESKAKKMYISNLMTQHGETDDFKVSDCVKILNKYMGSDFLDVVVSSCTTIPKKIKDRYKTLEQSDPILVDPMFIDDETLNNMGIELIKEDLTIIVDETVRHDALKTAFVVFSYLMR
ncbi:MAG: uridine diphosphate-N-acetylglucosamine-binding protein YvcK [Bacilli bacterium]|nr:uridine diphosphate-N-acetylglucosamine-binding protein YvcK [Bacilli bacterium]